MFGAKKRKSKDEQTTLPKLDLLETAAPRNDEVTVQITPTRGCMVNTAMATHIGTREYQQDAAYVSAPLFEGELAFGVLCDGMGGMAEGERVSSDVVAFMANQIATLSPEQDVPTFFETCAGMANEMVLAENQKSGQESGTTLIAIIVRKDELYWLNVGDSRIYIIRDGEIAQVSRDHNFALELQEMVQAGRITQQQADTDPRKDALVSYMGAPVLELMDVNHTPFKLNYQDIILLCSDGLTKLLTDDEILAAVKQHGSDLANAAHFLPLDAMDASAGGMDNTSVILMQYLAVAQ